MTDAASADLASPPAAVAPPTAASAIQRTPEQLQQLVAPIALYPDALVAQILAGSTHIAEVVEADRWMQANSQLTGQALAAQVDQQSWDASVKALTEFPSVLANMDQNVVWASALGDAYLSQPQQLMAAIQVMRQRAEAAGNLQDTEQQTIATDGDAISIAPVDPEVVYVPEYDPWLVYGVPVAVWPGWYPYPGLYLDGFGIAFGVGFGVWYFGGYGWGWHHWGPDWRHHAITFDHNPYVWRNRSVVDADHFFRSQEGLAGVHNGYSAHSSYGAVSSHGPAATTAVRGFAVPRAGAVAGFGRVGGIAHENFGRAGFGVSGGMRPGGFGGQAGRVGGGGGGAVRGGGGGVGGGGVMGGRG